MRSQLALATLALSGITLVACSGSPKGSDFESSTTKDSGASTGRADGGGDDSVDGGTDPGSFGNGTSDASIGAGNTCVPDPSNYDVPGDKCDNDGDGQVDNVTACDTGLSAGGDAMAFAKSIGLCQTAGATDTKWGVISATYTNGHKSAKPPADAQHGILGKFGSVVVPREGAMLGVISSGSATEQDSDDGPFFKGFKEGMQGAPSLIPGLPGGGQGGDAPKGYPAPSPQCNNIAPSTDVNDVINVKLVVRVPANAKGLAFDFDFWSGEWPEFVCSTYNDSFIAYLSSQAFNNGTPDNMSFDAKNNPVSVNNGFFDRCTPNAQTGCSGDSPGTAACAGGVGELAGTGFENVGDWCSGQSTGGGATGWLTSQAPVTPGETITLEFMIWDTGDASYDSSVLIDNFQWQGVPTVPGTQRPPPK